ncbi:MAG: DNA-processing protein DprA [Oscillospiraceae bacterium]|nr:DNA-processing protein DprA [Oscillospiraceae bacterium]
MDMDNNSEFFKWLWLVSCFGPGNKRIWDIINIYDMPEKNSENSLDCAYNMLRSKEARKKLLKEKEIQKAEAVNEEQISVLFRYCAEHEISLICFSDPDYPERLRNIYNPPAVLFYRGDISCLGRELVLAVVGTRKPSDYSIKVANALVRGLCAYELTLVSGFAEGIDIASHISAVRNGGKTAAILGCGLDYDYPLKNIKYREEILRNGVFISEYLPKTRPSKMTFPYRNRILSGLSQGAAVIEASKKSGSLVTANLALGQGRDVFAVPPHNLFDLRYQGNAELLRDGALPIYGLQDILYEYYENYSHKLTNVKQGEKIEPKSVSADYAKTENKAAIDFSELTDDERAIAALLQKHNKPLLPDEISALCGIDISEVLGNLTALEIEGIVKPSEGGRFMLQG